MYSISFLNDRLRYQADTDWPIRTRAIPRTVYGWVTGRIAIQSQRRALAALDERLRVDIGLSRDEALAEARKPFWRA
jgi:uncharacterized protein YjiS (DUF1127 family)